jgi:hypothetical protein
MKRLKMVIIVILSIILGVLMTGYSVGYDSFVVEKIIEMNFVSSEFGTKCYSEGQEHGNIEHFMNFDTLEDCLDYITNK